jgi:hypothetical protein
MQDQSSYLERMEQNREKYVMQVKSYEHEAIRSEILDISAEVSKEKRDRQWN